MNYDTSSQFENTPFREILHAYEQSVENKSSVYLEADEFVDIAEYYLENDRIKEAEQVINTALKVHPDDADVLIFLSRSAASNDDLEKAYRFLAKITDQNDREVRFLQVELLAQEERWEECDQIFQKLAEDEAYSSEVLADIVNAYADQGNKAYAKKWLKTIRDHGYELDKNDELIEMLCNYYFNFDNIPQAIELFKKLIDKHPYSLAYWIGLAKCYMRDERYPEAEETLDYALAINDKDATVLELKGGCFLEAGDIQAALETYKRFEEASVNKEKAWSYITKIYLELQDYHKAIEYSMKIIRHPNSNQYISALAYQNMANAYGHLGQPSKGMAYLTKAIEMDAETITFYVTEGFLYLLMARKPEAMRSFGKARSLIEAEDDDTEYMIWLQIATSCLDAKDLDLAITYFQQIEEKYSDRDKSCYLFLAYCYFCRKNYAGTVRYLTLLRKYTPEIYEKLGTDDDPMNDTLFKDSIANVKREISTGEIDVSKFEAEN